MTEIAPPQADVERWIIEYGMTAEDLAPRKMEPYAAELVDLGLPWPGGLEPRPTPPEFEPKTSDPLPQADYVVITWTMAELEALSDVFTPGYSRNQWYRYDRFFEDKYRRRIRRGAPALGVNRLASYFPVTIGDRKVLCMKSELHLNQDGIKTAEGTATLPVADLFRQIIDEAQPTMVITVGTAGATFPEHALGDVIITRGAKFRLSREFRNEAFNGKTYRCDCEVPKTHLDTARTLLERHAEKLKEPDFGPPTKRYTWGGPLIPGPVNEAELRIDGRDFAAFHPMLTTDYFEFGTSANRLQEEGCGVEMGDAVLGMVAEELGEGAPRWLVIRNASDPQINADLPDSPRNLNMQAHWAVWYYETYGYWTSVNSAIAVWAVIAG